MFKFEDLASITVEAIKEVKDDGGDTVEEKTEEEQRQQKVKEHVNDMIDNSSFHGVNYIVDDRNTWRRLFWFVITFSFLIISMEKVYESTVEYLSYPVANAIMRHHVEELEFPAVSFCNLNDIRKSIVNNSMVDEAVKTHNEKLLRSLNASQYKILDNAPHLLEEMLVECIFDGQPCSHKNFSMFRWHRGDKCFTFNSGVNRKALSITGPGRRKGLMLTINIQHYEYYRDVANCANGGIRLIIHGQDETPVRYVGMHVHPGHATHIAIDKKKIKNLPSPYPTACGSRVLTHFRRYSMNTCWLSQLTDYVYEQCNCSLQFMPGNGRKCDGEGMFCAWGFWEKFNMEKLEDCPLPCVIDSFHMKTSHSLFPSSQYASELRRRMEMENHMKKVFSKTKDNLKFMRHNLLRVILFYEDLSYELQEQQPSYDLSFFLGDIGGQIGLFIGAGAMSYFEFIDCLGLVIYSKFFEKFKSSPS